MGGPGLLLVLTAAKYLQQQNAYSSNMLTAAKAPSQGLTEHQQWKADKAAMHVMVFGHDSSSQPVAKAFRLACNGCNAGLEAKQVCSVLNSKQCVMAKEN